MVSGSVSSWQRGAIHSARALPRLSVAILSAFLLLSGCGSSNEGVYRGTVSHRVIELRSGSAYITEGGSTQAVAYEVADDKVVLKMPFMNVALQRMPDGSLTGMGETLIKVNAPSQH
jgi:hypothetical protein